MIEEDAPYAAAREALDQRGLLDEHTQGVRFFLDADDFLLRNGDRTTPAKLLAAMQINDSDLGAWLTEVGGNRETLGRLFTASILVPTPPRVRLSLARNILIHDLLLLIHTQPQRADSPSEVYAALRWRSITLPQGLVSALRNANPYPARAVARQGFSDLFVVRSEWIKYVAGELAYVENVLAGESRLRQQVQTTEREVRTEEDTRSASIQELAVESRDRSEFSDETSRDVELAVKMDAQVDTSGQYGPTRLDTHLGGSIDYSQSDSMRHAASQAKETVSRALNRVEQAVRTMRVERQLTRTEETNRHAIRNTSAKSRSGMYRWVEKIQRFQVFRYPNRYLVEFQVPEPAAWWLWRAKNRPMPATSAPKPVPLTLTGSPETPNGSNRLTAAEITRANYLQLGARYAVLGLTPPPPASSFVAAVFAQDTTNPRDVDAIKKNDPVRFTKLGDVNIPPGFRPIRWFVNGDIWGEPAWARTNTSQIKIACGRSARVTLGPSSNTDAHTVIAADAGNEVDGELTIDRPYVQQSLPFSLMMDNVRGYQLHVTLELVPTNEAFARWQLTTYSRIADAYYAMERAHSDELAAQAIRSAPDVGEGSPERNRQVVAQELKRQIVSMLHGTQTASTPLPFTWANAVPADSSSREPTPNAALAEPRTERIQFLEQAFEWDKISYVMYPYFWADKATRWTELASIPDGNDPEFAAFLRSGSARVVVSARPGFESQVQLFLALGVLWGGGTPPSPEDDDYLHVADEIRSLQKAPDDAVPGDWWDTRVPTSLLWLEGADPLPEKPELEITLGPRRGATN
jgi:hypothetical protein